MKRSPKIGFTLLELIVVMSIIGLLMSLLLPAVQAARDAARRVHCANNVKQLALGSLHHESAHQFFPSGGWGLLWYGDPDRGFGKTQPGGWIFSVLPYVDLQNLHDLGSGDTNMTTRIASTQCRMTTPLSLLMCPSRRPAILYPRCLDLFF